MIRSSRQLIAALLLALALLAAGTGAVAANTITGPSSSQSPYLVRAVPGAVTKAILTVGDTPAGSSYQPVAQHDADRFAPGAPNFLTQDEESSGIIDVSDILGDGWFLLDVQAHYATTTELVEGGQLLALHYPPGKK